MRSFFFNHEYTYNASSGASKDRTGWTCKIATPEFKRVEPAMKSAKKTEAGGLITGCRSNDFSNMENQSNECEISSWADEN
jgi:hypothetical protein